MPKPKHTQGITINGGKKRPPDTPIDPKAIEIKKRLDDLRYERECKQINAQ